MASRTLPAKFKQLFGTKTTFKFRESSQVQEVQLTRPGPNQLLIQNRFVGVNASEVNATAGRYNPKQKIPFPLGFEAIGQVVAVGDGCPHLLDKPVLYMQSGAFAEYSLVDYRKALVVPTLDKKYVSLLVSGLTAAMSLDKNGQIKEGDTVLITAAAGGTGQFAVQLAKHKGCHVIGTCSSEEKANFLKSIGCDRPVIYTKEDLNAVLQKEYPNGVDVVYETVGGKLFETAMKNLAVYARVVIIGYIESYLAEGPLQASDTTVTAYQRMPSILIQKSASVSGFFLFNETKNYMIYLPELVELYKDGKLQVKVDQGETAEGGLFVGLERISDAVDYLFSKKSKGKVIVELNPE